MTAQKTRPAPLAESGRAEVVGIKSNSASKPNQRMSKPPHHRASGARNTESIRAPTCSP